METGVSPKPWTCTDLVDGVEQWQEQVCVVVGPLALQDAH